LRIRFASKVIKGGEPAGSNILTHWGGVGSKNEDGEPAVSDIVTDWGVSGGSMKTACFSRLVEGRTRARRLTHKLSGDKGDKPRNGEPHIQEI
jgi:hypothetical protein